MAPIAAPATVLSTAESVCALAEVWPPIVSDAYCRHSPSSWRNASKDLPVPGSAIVLGLVGMEVQPTANTAAIITAQSDLDMIRTVGLNAA
jgi:hypothetical protein